MRNRTTNEWRNYARNGLILSSSFSVILYTILQFVVTRGQPHFVYWSYITLFSFLASLAFLIIIITDVLNITYLSDNELLTNLLRRVLAAPFFMLFMILILIIESFVDLINLIR
jgi:hypothetical protein